MGNLRARCEEFGQSWEKQIKEMVFLIGPGIEYNNGFAKVVISDNGGYCQVVDWPWEFSGWLNSEGLAHTFIDTRTAWDIYKAAIETLEKLTLENTRYFELLAFYNRDLQEEDGIFLYRFSAIGGEDVNSIGTKQPQKLPDYLKMRAVSELFTPFVKTQTGSLIMIPYLTDQHMVIAWSFEGEVDINCNEIAQTMQ